MRIPTEKRRGIGNKGTVLQNVDVALPHFIDFIRGCGIPYHAIGVRKSQVDEWKERSGEGKGINVSAGTLIGLCDAVNAYPHRSPRLPCISIEHGHAVWSEFERLWREWFPDKKEMWVPEGEPLFIAEQFADHLAELGLTVPQHALQPRQDEVDPDVHVAKSVNQAMVHWIASDQATVAQFVKESALIEKATRVELYLYTGETTIREWRQLLFDRIEMGKPLMIRLLIRNPKTDGRKRPQIDGTLDIVRQIEKYKGSQVKTEIRYFDDDPTFRLYFFSLEGDRAVCLAGFYHYNHNNPVRFEGAENARLLVLSTDEEAERTTISRLYSRFWYTWETSRIKAVIFDMDGVLIDGMKHHLAAWQKGFNDVDVAYDEDDFRMEIYKREGEKVDITAAELHIKYCGRKPTKETVERILAVRQSVHSGLASEIEPMSGIYELLESLQERKLPLAVVTGSSRDAADIIIRKRFADRFDVIVTGDDAERGKPDPMPYQIAVEKLRVSSDSCLVVENAPLGVKSALRAGLRVYGVLINSPLAAGDLLAAGAEQIFNSHEELERALEYPPVPAS